MIKIIKDNYEFRILENGVLLHTIKDVVVLPQEYNEYINTRKADDMRHETMPQLATPILKEFMQKR